MNNYKRLNMYEREEISRMLAQKYSFQDIADKLDRHKSTISREVRAGSCNRYTYRATRADNRAKRNASKRKSNNRKINDNLRLKRYIYKKLRLKWSPMQMHKFRNILHSFKE